MIVTGMLVLGLGMIGTGTGIGVRNIYKAGKNAGIKNEAILRKQIATQKEQIEELIDSEFQLNTLIKNINKSVKETAEAAEWALKLCAETYKEFGEKMAGEPEASEPDVEQVEAKDSAGEATENKASDEAEVNLAEAMIDAGITEEEAIAKAAAEAIREEERAASQKRYKSQKRGANK